MNAKLATEKFRDTLSKLTDNNKLLIDNLTDIAKDLKHAMVVTRVIEDRLMMVKPHGKLPIMYLIDSICKNIGEPYIEMFQQNLVSNFSHVFQECNKEVRFYNISI